MTYVPPQAALDAYADILVNFGLNHGEGLKPGEVVRVIADEDAKPLLVATCRAAWRAGGHVIHHLKPADDGELNLTAAFFELASEEQLDWAPISSSLAMIEQIDHAIHLFCERDPHALKDVDPARMMRSRRARRPLLDAQNKKEAEGRFTWTLALYGVPGMAAEAGMSVEEYWEQIIAGCYLTDPDPVARWRQISKDVNRYAEWLSSLPIDRLHLQGEDIDLRVTVGPHRRWLGGNGANIPSFEVFTTPDWRGTEGWVRFNQPVYIYGTPINGVELHFADGRVTRSSAHTGETLLRELIATDDGADKLGEVSMTDRRLSPIRRFMADTLYDENMGGRFGNSHVALGMAIFEAYTGDGGAATSETWQQIGFNESAVHTDFITTTDRTVTATLEDGSELVIYRDGQFTL